MIRLALRLAPVAIATLPVACAAHPPETPDVPGEPRVLVEDAAWTWFNDERAIFAGDLLYVGFVTGAGHAGAVVLSPDDPDPERAFRLGSFTEVDDHDNPAFLELADGRVLAAYAPHHTRPHWFWRTTEGVGSPISWTPERRTPELDAPTTYSNLVRLADEDDRIYNFFRGTNFDPVFMVSDDQGGSWGPVRHLIRSGDDRTRPYVKYATDGRGRFDLIYTQAHPRQAETDIRHVYYEDRQLRRSDGTAIQRLPGTDVGPMPVDAGTLVYEAAEAGRAWVWDLEYDADGAPVAVYVAARDSTVGNDLRYRYARWDAAVGAWVESEIARAGTHLYDGENHYAGGITLDPRDPRTVYVSSDVHPATGDPTAHYLIYRGRLAPDSAPGDSGAWSWESLTPAATADNIRPFVPRGGGEHHVVLWLRGRYTAYQDYDTDVVGLTDPR